MKEKFFDFGNANTGLRYTLLPFTKVKYVLIENGKPFHVKYKLCFKDESTIILIRGVETRDSSRNQVSGDSAHLPVIKQCRKTPKLFIEKKNDFISMLKFMPQQDRDYFEIAFQMPTNK